MLSLSASHAAMQPQAIGAEPVLAALLAVFVLLVAAENLWPKVHYPAAIRQRSYRTNLVLLACNSAALSLLSVSSLFMLAQHYSQHGLLRYLHNPFWQAALSFLLLDLLLYGWHRLCHSFDSLWMFHRVHHNDLCVNASTAFRVHLLESMLTNALKAAYVVVVGVDHLSLLVNEAVLALSALFHHSNVRVGGEKWLGRLLITPALHRTHHSRLRGEHDSNYGAVLSVWDRLFGSLKTCAPRAVGIDGPSPQDVPGLLGFGLALPKAAYAQPAAPANLEAMIAEAAYYKAEKRNFLPGYELMDWLEAKREIIGRFANGAANGPLRHC